MEVCPKRVSISRVTRRLFGFVVSLLTLELALFAVQSPRMLYYYSRCIHFCVIGGLTRFGWSNYSSARFDNYCSKCYHDLFGNAAKSPAPATTASTPSSETATTGSNASENSTASPVKATAPIAIGTPKSGVSSYVTSNNLKVSSSLPTSTYGSSMMDVDSPGTSPGTSPASFGESGGFLRKKRNLCAAPGCKKKLGLTAVECHCGHTFCSDHRYADKHGCTYDYKGAKTESLTKANPTVAPRKVAEI